MKISTNIFIGAYRERQELQSIDLKKLSGEKLELISKKAAEAIQEVKKQKNSIDTISISEEAKKFLCSEEGN